MRENLIRLAIQYQGDYSSIKKAVENNEIADESISLQNAVTILDDIYPNSLKQIKYPPFVLFYRGNITLLAEKKIAIVGSRQASQLGKYFTGTITVSLGQEYVAVSGMAKGIDTIVHQYAIKSIGVLGNGLDIIYPVENRKLYQYMELHQLLLSEYPENVKPLKRNFPFRNRIIAGLAGKVIVTEATLGSGSIITAKEGLKQGKEVYVVDYTNDQYQYQGLQHLIEKGCKVLNKYNIDTILK